MKKILLFSGLGILLLGIAAGVLLGEIYDPNNVILGNNVSSTEIRAGGYKFINPLLECEYGQNSYSLNGLDSLHDEINAYLQNQKNNRNITDAAVYFRDLNNGPWFGINEHADFSPASLLKLPVMMAYFKKAENEPGILAKEIVFKENPLILNQDFSKPILKNGEKYSARELIEKMIVYSDNDALVLLENNIESKLIDKVTLDLGVETADANTPENFMSVKGYAGLFRILFNASYLTPKYSEEALEILSKTQFDKGITAGLPKNITVALKYGERELPEGVQLHECGIVYYPDHPYLLCIMTRGANYDKLASVIKNVSKTTYNDLNSRYTNK